MLRWAVLTVVVAIAPAVAAEPLVSLSGRVTDAKTDEPVEGAVVYVVGADRESKLRTTDRAGRYKLELPPGAYDITFIAGTHRTSSKVGLLAGHDAVANGKVATSGAEVIEIEGTLAEPRAPKPKNFVATRAPKYSDEAILTNAWTRAWLLLAVDETGEVTMFKFLKRPGYDLEGISAEEVFALHFEPATDADGTPIRCHLVWAIEWPANGWMLRRYGTQRLPTQPAEVAAVPCAGSGPMQFGSLLYRGYRDCSTPDLSAADDEAWILPEE